MQQSDPSAVAWNIDEDITLVPVRCGISEKSRGLICTGQEGTAEFKLHGRWSDGTIHDDENIAARGFRRS